MRKEQLMVNHEGEECIMKYSFSYKDHNYLAVSSDPFHDQIAFFVADRIKGHVHIQDLPKDQEKEIKEVYKRIEAKKPSCRGEHYEVGDQIVKAMPLVMDDEISLSLPECLIHMVLSMVITALFAYFYVDNILVSTSLTDTTAIKMVMIALSGIITALAYYGQAILGNRLSYTTFFHGLSALLIPYLFLGDPVIMVIIIAMYASLIIADAVVVSKKGNSKYIVKSEGLTIYYFVYLIFSVIALGVSLYSLFL